MLMREDSRTYLSRYLLPGSIDEARIYLTDKLSTATLYAFCDESFPAAFRSRFPREWRRDQEKLLPDQEAGRPWGEGELSCLEMISDLRIPFFYDHVQMMAEEEGERTPVVPLLSFGIDLWDGSQMENEGGWRMIALLLRDQSAYKESFSPTVWNAFKRARPSADNSWSWEIFKATCATCKPPLSALWMALQMLNHDTRNVFLDPTYETPFEDAGWTWEDLEWLAGEWEEAQDFIGKANRLAGWLAANPKHFRKVVDVWNLATWTMLMRE